MSKRKAKEKEGPEQADRPPRGLAAIPWKHPGIVGPLSAAIAAGLLTIVQQLMQPASPAVQIGLDKNDVGQEIKKAIDPGIAGLEHGQQAIIDQLAQLAPRQTVPLAGDPLKIKAVVFLNAGLDAYRHGEIGQARGHWLDALELDPDYAKAHYNLGIALKAKGELDAAIEHYESALRIDPDYAKAHNNLGNALRAKGDLDGAIEHYQSALRIDPDYAKAHNNLGNALRAKGDLDGAIEHFQSALRIDPDYAYAHNNLGLALKDKGELEAAIEHYRAAMRINPKSARYHDNLAIALARTNLPAAAVAALARAIELDPRYRAWAKTDKNYDSIRDERAFAELVYGQ